MLLPFTLNLPHFLITLINTRERQQLFYFHLAVKIDLVEVVYYMKSLRTGISFAI